MGLVKTTTLTTSTGKFDINTFSKCIVPLSAIRSPYLYPIRPCFILTASMPPKSNPASRKKGSGSVRSLHFVLVTSPSLYLLSIALVQSAKSSTSSLIMKTNSAFLSLSCLLVFSDSLFVPFNRTKGAQGQKKALLRNGRLIPFLTFYLLLNGTPWIRQFRLR